MDYWMVHQNVAQKVGIMPAVLLCMLIGEEPKKGQPFTIQDEEFRKKFDISRRTFDNCLNTLELHQLILTKRLGVPCRKFYFINHELYNKIAMETKK
jgi:hypothetical protein